MYPVSSLSLEDKWFVNDSNLALVLRRINGYRQSIMIRITNRSDFNITPVIGLSDDILAIDSTVSGSVTVPRANDVIEVPAVDALGTQFTEQYVWLYYTNAGGDILGVGAEFALMQDFDFEPLDFYDDSVAIS